MSIRSQSPASFYHGDANANVSWSPVEKEAMELSNKKRFAVLDMIGKKDFLHNLFVAFYSTCLCISFDFTTTTILTACYFFNDKTNIIILIFMGPILPASGIIYGKSKKYGPPRGLHTYVCSNSI